MKKIVLFLVLLAFFQSVFAQTQIDPSVNEYVDASECEFYDPDGAPDYGGYSQSCSCLVSTSYSCPTNKQTDTYYWQCIVCQSPPALSEKNFSSNEGQIFFQVQYPDGSNCYTVQDGPLGSETSEIDDPTICDAGCTATCGNGVIEICSESDQPQIEECDDGDTDPNDGCNALCQVEDGFTCTGEPSVCDPLNPCGNGVIDAGEECDEENFNGQTCESLGFGQGGTLNCFLPFSASQCEFDTSSCNQSIPPSEQPQFTQFVITDATLEPNVLNFGEAPANFLVTIQTTAPLPAENLLLTFDVYFLKNLQSAQIHYVSNPLTMSGSKETFDFQDFAQNIGVLTEDSYYIEILLFDEAGVVKDSETVYFTVLPKTTSLNISENNFLLVFLVALTVAFFLARNKKQ